MLRIDHRTVELNRFETHAKALFEDNLDHGMTIHQATAAVKAVPVLRRHLSDDFLTWLGGDNPTAVCCPSPTQHRIGCPTA